MNIKAIRIVRIVMPLIVALLVAQNSFAQREITREEYISTYAPLAIQQQKQYGIPASIKLAQGILESRYGNSDLSRRSNNHFGIKCKSYWTGDSVTYDDDEKGECFRRYNTIEESYRDHSEFLRNGSRYSSLFELDPTDYKGWAHGLKAAGYATAPHYATSLIKCIEDYELYLFDDGEYPSYLAGVQPVTFLNMAALHQATDPLDLDNFTVSVYTAGGHGIFSENGVRYIVASAGETYRTLARSLGLTEKRLRRYNRSGKEEQPAEGEVIYIEKNRSARRRA